MKHKSILSLFIFLLGFGATTTSCEDMLTPDMDRYAESFSGTDTVYFYLGILRNVQDMVEQNELLGELRGDLVTTTEYSSDSISNIVNYSRDADGENALLNRAAYYKVINQCNFYLAKVDTNAVKNNVYYMRKEYAQVVAIRAWTYLQLVQTYGTVPFITKPVENADTGWETNPENWATADNLVDLLKPEMEQAIVYEHTLGYPAYKTYSTGYNEYGSYYLRFYNNLVLGDLYLLRSHDRSDYVNAAKNYYYFLKQKMEEGEGVSDSYQAAADVSTSNATGRDFYTYDPSDWISEGLGASSVTSENITIIPSAANSSFGRVLSRTQQICGFDPTSSNSTSTDIDEEEGTTTSTTSGSVSVTTNYRSRQITASQAYLNLCAAQTYTMPTLNAQSSTNVTVEDIKIFDDIGDVRLYATSPIIETTNGGKLRYITKYSPCSNIYNNGQASMPSFKYYKSLYRLKQVYLRYAEAINRAGYPRHAFMILRDGINFEKMPTVADSVHYDDLAKTKQIVYYLDSSTVYNAANYVGVDELRRAQADADYANYIDFSDNIWDNDGIHEQGCGISTIYDTAYAYDAVVAQRITDEALRTGSYTQEVKSKVKALRKGIRADEDETGEDIVEEPVDRTNYAELAADSPTEADPLEINAVETLIADEFALETAFEGSRMFDLIRFARHKDNDTNFAAGYGTQWLAWKIARRTETLKPYETPGQYDATLYNTLLNSANWYMVNPEY